MRFSAKHLKSISQEFNPLKKIEQFASFGGQQEIWKHGSEALSCEMKVAVYRPPQALSGSRCPVLYWLSGLTCTEQNFITKAGSQRLAAKYGVIVVAPDTSPRGDGVADDNAYDLGQGAGFYVDATKAPWDAHYQMQTYVASELPELVEKTFGTSDMRGITGHSMGGHGALVTALRNPGRYHSVSAFSPIVAPSQVPWGQKAFDAYLGANKDDWAQWDAIELLKSSSEFLDILVDQGSSDAFLGQQLRPDLLEAVCKARNHRLSLRLHDGFDHSYYFIATFLEDHFAHHAKAIVKSW